VPHRTAPGPIHALADWLTTHQRTIDAQPLYAAARAIYQQLNAQAWLDQLDLACPTISST
jgi:hypothetical protein